MKRFTKKFKASTKGSNSPCAALKIIIWVSMIVYKHPKTIPIKACALISQIKKLISPKISDAKMAAEKMSLEEIYLNSYLL